MQTYLLIFAISLLAGLALILSQHWHGRYSRDNAFGVQNHHTEPAPRIGGVTIAIGLVATWAMVEHDVSDILGPILLASISAFVFGLA